jgi:hypothetical protein
MAWSRWQIALSECCGPGTNTERVVLAGRAFSLVAYIVFILLPLPG